MNKAELYQLGRLYFEDGLYEQALIHLTRLFERDHDYNEQDLARMLLWIHTTEAYYEAPIVVEMFEILRERYPSLEIPFDKILVVGRAYRDIGEFERALLVYQATINASFISDSNVSAELEDAGRFLQSIDYQKALWQTYPDTATVVSSYFALTQALYNKAPNAHKLPKENDIQPNRIDMLDRTTRMLTDFLTLYPNDPLADDAGFSMANAFLDLENYSLVVTISQRFAKRYTKMSSSFRYMEALGHFWQNDYKKALKAAIDVARGESKDKPLAQYIAGQIHHAQGNPADAIEWYEKIKRDYPDAREAIAYFEDTEIKMEEVNTFEPGKDVTLPLEYRNIKKAFLQIYRVDLMKLYLREKDLSRISQIHLAGIAPELEKNIELGDGKDYVNKKREIPLNLTEEGAYLVICRGDNLFTSGLVLITPLKIEVQRYDDSGRMRANVLDALNGGYRANVHVKAIGSADKTFRSGDTDLRGIFVADNLRGIPTIIAKEGESRYAFYRGTEWVGARKDQRRPQQSRPQKPTKERQQNAPMDYQRNLRKSNQYMQKTIMNQFDQVRRTKQKGVEVQSAF
jgi:tetratricopeptide (TPR) repeat protein